MIPGFEQDTEPNSVPGLKLLQFLVIHLSKLCYKYTFIEY